MSKFKPYRRTQTGELRPYIPGEDISHVSVSSEDEKNGSPKQGDMIARNPDNHNDQWLVAKDYFEKNFKSMTSRMRFGRLRSDGDHNYVIPLDKLSGFDELSEQIKDLEERSDEWYDLTDEFDERYRPHRVEGDLYDMDIVLK